MHLRGKAFKQPAWQNRMINFDDELDKGQESYNQVVGKWWLSQADDRSHKIAYKKIAQEIRLFCKHEPETILDFACGGGQLLAEVAKLFPKSKFIGVDGSHKMLEKAKERLPQATFIETYLPDFKLKEKADLVIFCFPNIAPGEDCEDFYNEHGYQHPDDAKVAKYLSEAKDPEEEETDDPEELYDDILTDKVISRNLRQLCKDGGMCVRVTYSNAKRADLSKLGQLRTDFEEGCLALPVDGVKAEQLFSFEESIYKTSKVILDVYHQTEDEDDKTGGYFVSFLRAI